MRIKSIVILLGLLGLPFAFGAESEITNGPSELEWCRQNAFRYNAEAEVILWDNTRVDLLTDTEAIEVDWAPHWAEAIGQAQYYSLLTGKQPAIILLTKKNEEQFVYRCQSVCAKLGMTLYVEKL